tara:strand:+ start:709 stop:2922 length:2214 start_codon:yes stop_codon:yes gene_type:complete
MQNEEIKGNQFGTFGGVFTPSILTILGVIMFMLAGKVTGEAGIFNAILILLLAKSITFLTSLSISAISTNMQMRGGGAYFMISRSLGPEFGGAIGLTLFLAQALSVPFYILGFAGAVVLTFPALKSSFMLITIITACVLFLVNYIGADWAIRVQYLILAVLVVAIVVFIGGSILRFNYGNFTTNWSAGYTKNNNFWTIFAVYFPAVTGIMAGVNMSGDLKEPARSIPKGTLWAVGVGAAVYLAQILITGGAQTRGELINQPYQTLLSHSLFGFYPAVIAGVFAATLSSALGSFLGAPRILQALSRDDIFPPLRPFEKGSEGTDEPVRGLWLTFGMTLLVLFLVGNKSGGALELVASILSMFFLYTYGITNIAAFIESASRNPSFRPRFRLFHWFTALLGAIGCIGAAFLIDMYAALFAMGTLLLLFTYVRQRVLTTAFGDARRGFFFSRVRDNLYQLQNQPHHPKNWRPTTLVLSGNPHTRLTLTTYAIWLESGRGIVTLAEVLVGEFEEFIDKRQTAKTRLSEFIKDNSLRAYGEVIIASDFDHGLSTLLQAHSIGPLKPNLVMLGWPNSPERIAPFSRHLKLANKLDMSIVIAVERGIPDHTSDKRIDVWWRGEKNGSLMLILAHLLKQNWEWSRAKLRILRVVFSETHKQKAHDELFQLVDAARIDATIEVIVSQGAFSETLHSYSADATAVFLGFYPPNEEAAASFHKNYSELLEGLPTTLLINSSGQADLLA